MKPEYKKMYEISDVIAELTNQIERLTSERQKLIKERDLEVEKVLLKTNDSN